MPKKLATLVVGVVVAFSIVHPLAARAASHKVRFFENSDSTMYGVHGQWDDPFINQGIDCPNSGVNYLQSFVRVEFPGGSKFIETGVEHDKDAACDTEGFYYQQFDIGSGTQFFVDPAFSVSNANHEYAINQVNGDWFSRVDGGSTYERKCCNFFQIDDANQVRVGMECQQDTAGDCLSDGKVNPNNGLTYKPSPAHSGSWPPWGGTDGRCLDYSEQARGKWNSDTSVQYSFNESISGSLTSPSC